MFALHPANEARQVDVEKCCGGLRCYCLCQEKLQLVGHLRVSRGEMTDVLFQRARPKWIRAGPEYICRANQLPCGFFHEATFCVRVTGAGDATSMFVQHLEVVAVNGFCNCS